MFNFLRKIRFATRSPKWKDVRKKHIDKQNQCQFCGSSKNLEVHHIVPVHINPELELDPDNLITLCDKNCHLLIGHFMNFKSWNPEVIKECNIMQNNIKNRKYF